MRFKYLTIAAVGALTARCVYVRRQKEVKRQLKLIGFNKDEVRETARAVKGWGFTISQTNNGYAVEKKKGTEDCVRDTVRIAAGLRHPQSFSKTRTFEVHLTSTATNLLKDACKESTKSRSSPNLKYVEIVLPKGADCPLQPMCSFHISSKSVQEAAVATYDVMKWLEARFITVTRYKVEILLSEKTDSEDKALALQPGDYYEFHIKTNLLAESDLERLHSLSLDHGAHVSRNARKALSDGSRDWFTTLRHRIPLKTAFHRFRLYCEALTDNGFEIVSRHRELAICDSNVMLDKGWVE
eukprot:TRINITY_DN3285_c0_g1_i1.p1 TRINITY_DN3285_c0_g1~~TRINITY_DN3285_c0_g1_i1.p1  ORF type:complete len:298 (+),score=5.60 TRINITY_DN3285_c0_g1_i1:37-930(+)